MIDSPKAGAGRPGSGHLGTPNISDVARRNMSQYGVILLGLIFYLFTIRSGQRAGDFSMFLQHAANMVAGAPYGQSSYVQNPDAISVGTTSYPPGIPVLIAPLHAVFGFDLVPEKALFVLMFFAALLVFGMTTERLVPWPFFTLMLVDLCFTPYFWAFKDNVESDFPFLLPVFAALYLIAKSGENQDRPAPSVGEGIALGALMYVAVSMRTIGLALIISFFFFDLMRNRRLIPSQYFWVTAATLGLLMVGQSLVLTIDGGTYSEAFFQRVGDPAKFATSIVLNAKYYLLAVTGRMLMSNGHGTAWADAMLLLSIGPFTVGLWQRLRHERSILEVFTVVYAGILLVWPFRQPNYLIPLIPLLAFYLFAGLGHLVRNLSDRRRYAVAAGVFVLLIATYVPRYLTLSFDRIPHDAMSEASMEFYDFVQTELDDTSGIITRLPREVALFTNRRSTPPRHAAGDAEHYSADGVSAIIARARDMNFHYIAAGPRGFEYHQEILPLWNLLDDHPELFEPVWSNSEWRVVRIVTEG